MWLTTDTTTALAKARNDKKTLSSVKADTPEDAGTGDVSGALEALAAVIPTGTAAIYTGGALVVRSLALAAGTDDRSTAEASMAKAGKSAAQIKEYLDGLPLESDKYFWLRILILVAAFLTAVILAWRSAKDANSSSKKKRKRFIAEPFTAGVALFAWALASPGTPLAAKLNAADTTAWTAGVVVIAVFVLAGTGNLVLKKSATTS